MSRAKWALEVSSSLLMGVAAVVLLYSLLNTKPVTAWEDADVTMAANQLRYSKGSGDRVVVMFSDYQCPACLAFAQSVFPDVSKQLLGAC